jgi:hypothetical protein
MLRIDDEQNEVQTIKIKTCGRIIMHFEWEPWLNPFLIHIVG